MAVSTYDELRDHIGHKVAVAYYGQRNDPDNVAIECRECNDVLIDFDRPAPATASRHKLTADEVRELQNGVQLHVRLTRLYYPHPETEYEGPSTLYVQRHPKTGAIVGITTGDPAPGWVEYDPRRGDLLDNREAGADLVVEDYMMELFTN